jgi:hypothetical protein
VNEITRFALTYSGLSANFQTIDLYDVAQALVGFQRSLALTTHLVLNGEIITQAPSLKGAHILAEPAEAGSWKTTAIVLTTLAIAPKDSLVGNILYSVYDYVVSESLGVHANYDKTLGQLYEESHNRTKASDDTKGLPAVKEHQIDSLIEKCTTAIEDIHRPLVRTETASVAMISYLPPNAESAPTSKIVGRTLTAETYEYMHEFILGANPEIISGRISSYNSNTFKGRIYVQSEGRPVSFELTVEARLNSFIQLIVASLSANAVKKHNDKWSVIYCSVLRITSRSGHLKSYKVIAVFHQHPQ